MRSFIIYSLLEKHSRKWRHFYQHPFFYSTSFSKGHFFPSLLLVALHFNFEHYRTKHKVFPGLRTHNSGLVVHISWVGDTSTRNEWSSRRTITTEQRKGGYEGVAIMAALAILNEANCPGGIDLPWHISLMIYGMVTVSVLVASYAAGVTCIFFFFELHFIPRNTIRESQRGSCSMYCTPLQLGPFRLAEKGELDW